MPTPDVRVRLSAEGTAEVVAALKQIQAEGQKAAQKQADGFLGFNKVLAGTRNLLGGLGIALGVNQMRRFLGNVVRMGDELGDSATAVGANTANLSALNLILRTSGSSAEEGAKALAKVNKTLEEARAGAPNAIATLKNLGLTLDDFRGKDSVEAFELIAKRISAIPLPAARGKIAMDIFGRSGANLIPTMKELADEGLGAVIERARELGVLIDQDTVNALDRLADDAEVLKLQAEGIAAQFMGGLAPGLSTSLEMVRTDMTGTSSTLERVGEVLGRVLVFITGIQQNATDAVRTFIEYVAKAAPVGAKAMSNLFRGQVGEAKGLLEEIINTGETMWDEFLTRIENRARLTLGEQIAGPQIGGGGGGGGGGGAGGKGEDDYALAGFATPSELANKRALAMQTALDRELAFLKAAASLRTKTEKLAFDEGLKDVTAYYADRLALVDRAYEDEVAILERKRGLLGDITDPGQRLQYEKQIETELARLKLTHETQVAELLGEERETVRDLGRERLDLEQTLLQLQGKRTEAERLGFEERIRQADLLLRQEGKSDAEREATLARLRSGLEAGADFEDAKRAADAALSEYDSARREIEARASEGLISQLESESQILAVEQSRIETLEALASALEAAALATGDPEKIAEAERFSASIREMGYAIEASASAWTQLRTTLIDSATGALATFFNEGVTGAKSFGDAFRDMTLSILSDLKRLASQMLASGIMDWITGLFSAGGKVGSGGSGVETLGDQSMELSADGGLLRGPGTETSDSILLRASNWEYITRAAVVKQPGVLEHLEALNRFGAKALLPAPVLRSITPARFAAGGPVGHGATLGAASSQEGRLLIGLDDGLVLRHMESAPGQRVIVGAIAKNRRAIRAALGITK